MNIKAKMKCASVLKTEFGNTVKFNAVSDGSPENKTFSNYTPSAHLEIVIDNPAAKDAFEPGKEYYLDFTPADAAPAQ